MTTTNPGRAGDPTAQVDDDMVEAHARAVYALYTADTLLPEWDECRESVREDYRDEARLHLTALVASGWRREADVRAEVAADVTRFADRARARAYQYAPELPIGARVSNDCVVNAYYKAGSLARSGDDRNPHCANCGDLRGGPRGHETSECKWDPCNSAEHKRASALDQSGALPVAASSETESLGGEVSASPNGLGNAEYARRIADRLYRDLWQSKQGREATAAHARVLIEKELDALAAQVWGPPVVSDDKEIDGA